MARETGHDAGNSTKDETVSIEPKSTVQSAHSEGPGSRIGVYKLLQQIGEGGFGSVYMAEQEKPVKRRVALKIIKLGMDTKQVIARFEQERQALAILDHPNIAKVFDAGATETGRPYFAMELCTGEPIDEYCDRNKLSIAERLELFAQVCAAVQHAHTKGLIHRDLKPSNVLVSTQDGKPLAKVIDFGIAKATSSKLTERTLFTEHKQLIGTPEYMSPEQAEGSLDIDTRSDVYSLGVLLYALLTGTTPFNSRDLRSAAYAEIQRVIREVDPPKPSTRLTQSSETLADIANHRKIEPSRLSAMIRGELDWIVMRALEKDRTRRYESASDFAADIRRYLSGEAVEAAPPSTTYRVRTFIRRNKGIVAAGALVSAVLVLGTIGTSAGFISASHRAEGERVAKVEAEKKQKLAEQKTTEAELARSDAIAARNEIEYNSYVANLEMADAWRALGRYARVFERLAACPERLRGWEWNWYSAISDTSLLTFNPDSDRMSSATYSPDGRHIALACWSGEVHIVHAESGETVRVLQCPDSIISPATYNHSGSRIITNLDFDSFTIFDTETGRRVCDLVGHAGQSVVAVFSPDDSIIATGSHDKTVRLWDASTGEQLAVLSGHSDRVVAIDFNPDGSRLVSCSEDGSACVWDVASRTCVHVLRGHTDRLYQAKFSPDGTVIATASADGTARVWDAETGNATLVYTGHSAGLGDLSFGARGSLVATAAGDGTARVWDVRTGETQAVCSGHEGFIAHVRMSPDGDRVVTYAYDGKLRLWDARTGDLIANFRGHTETVQSVEFSPDGSRVVTAALEGVAKVWDAHLYQPNYIFEGHKDGIGAIALTPDGTRLVTASDDSTVRVWDVVSGRSIFCLQGHQDFANRLAITQDGTRAVSGSFDGTARVWDIYRGEQVSVTAKHQGNVTSVAFDRDGTRFVTASEDGTSRVWDTATGEQISRAQFEPAYLYDAEFLGDQHVVSAGEGNAAYIWDAATGEVTRTLEGHLHTIYDIDVNHDNTRVVTASADGRPRLWDARTGECIAVMRGHSSNVLKASFSSDGSLIVTSGFDQTARVWDGVTGELKATMSGHSSMVYQCVFMQNNTRLVTTSEDATARVWDVTTGKSLAELRGHTMTTRAVAISPDGTRIYTGSYDGTARVWDTVPARERLSSFHTIREARADVLPMLDTMLQSGATASDARSRVLAHASLTPNERDAALIELVRIEDAGNVVDEQKLERALDLNSLAWAAVAQLPVTKEAADKAVQQAQEAVDLAPSDADILNTLGVALYRASEYQQALETLQISAEMTHAYGRDLSPADWAFIAMSQWNLGMKDEAAQSLAAFQAMAEGAAWNRDPDTVQWIEEIKTLMQY
ncbi:MAG: protein kinase [Phycisphaeraceae bacterium]|nr:protein kinase [Phycisphaerales bacterium]MCB9858902.1 protein kinase [Phycisphaeraceae bacterium]